MRRVCRYKSGHLRGSGGRRRGNGNGKARSVRQLGQQRARESPDLSRMKSKQMQSSCAKRRRITGGAAEWGEVCGRPADRCDTTRSEITLAFKTTGGAHDTHAEGDHVETWRRTSAFNRLKFRSTHFISTDIFPSDYFLFFIFTNFVQFHSLTWLFMVTLAARQAS